MDNFSVLKEIDKNQWLSLLENFPIDLQDIYYLPQYYELYEKNGEGKAECFKFEKNGEIAIYPFLRNSVNKVGYELDQEYFDIQGAYGYNGVLSTSYDPDFISSFSKEFSSYCQDNNIIAEFTRFHPLLNNHEFSKNHFDVYLDRETVWLDLTKDYDTIWQEEYSGRNRNMIRKAEKLGVTSYISNEDQDYMQFIELYHETMKNVGASDYFYFDYNYFQNIRDGLRSHHHLIVSKVNDEFAGGMLLFIYGDFAHYHLSARKFEFGKYAVNNHFLDQAVRVAKENGCKKLHFGGGLSADIKDPLLKFKSDFSKQRSIFYFGKKIHNQKVYNAVVAKWEETEAAENPKYAQQLLKYRY